MALDPYSLCPGGREKKIRFCCPDMVKEIEQIERLFESNQTGSCLSFIENLEKNHPNCACLTAAKLTVFRTQGRWDDALKTRARYTNDALHQSAVRQRGRGVVPAGARRSRSP